MLLAFEDGAHSLHTSPQLLAELADVIHRDKFAQAIAHNRISTTKELFDGLVAISHVVKATPLAQPICRDPDDDAVLACALAARADLIVSGDKDLLVLHAFQGIPILSAGQALARLGIPAA